MDTETIKILASLVLTILATIAFWRFIKRL
jgi:hypothetical protein